MTASLDGGSRRGLRIAGIAAGAASVLAPVGAQLRVGKSARRLTNRWRHVPVRPRGSTKLGITFRPRQAESFGLDPAESLHTLLRYPFELIRLGAHWRTMEPAPGVFRPDELDRQIDAAEAAGKRIILTAGGVKAFGSPEFAVPAHHLTGPLPQGGLVRPADFRPLSDGAVAFVTRVVRRYRDRESIVAWQVEHEAVDPIGPHGDWRLSVSFLRREIEAVRAADPNRPVMLNGSLPTSVALGMRQWWRTRDQGDSLDAAQQYADIVGIGFYPCRAIAAVGPTAVYLDGSRTPWQQGRRRDLFAWAAASPERELMVAEGQAEPWETEEQPPSPEDGGMRSCLPEHVIANYNQCMSWHDSAPTRISAYLFWGAEYWLRRHQEGDPRYLAAFARLLDNS